MDNKLTGYALDAAVAAAMGWIVHRGGTFIGYLTDPGPDAPRVTWPFMERGEEVRDLPRYSEDFGALPEMLEWLDTHGFWQVRRYLGHDAHYWVSANITPNLGVVGGTLTESIARLVVEVAAIKEKQP